MIKGLQQQASHICAMVKNRYIEDGHTTFNRNPYNGYMNPYYWVNDHPLLYGNNVSLHPGTYLYAERGSKSAFYSGISVSSHLGYDNQQLSPLLGFA